MPPTTVPDFTLELQLRGQGYARIAGLDEVGRGCLAGPVAAGAVILPPEPGSDIFDLVRDSKQLRALGLEAAYQAITRQALAYAVGWTSPAEIDRVGIGPAVRIAMHRALRRLEPQSDHLLIDAISLRATSLPQRSIVKGDTKSLSIASAAIVAKVERDRLLALLSDTYPGYGLAAHKGYGTQRHMTALARLGPSPIHRMSFRPVSGMSHRAGSITPAAAGDWAESFVAQAMEDRGAKLVERNYRTRYGEIDLVSSEGDTLVFVEVRARRSAAFASPAETVVAPKATRVIAACNEYLQTTSLIWSDWRIDVAEVELDRWRRPSAVNIIKSAIEDSD